MADNKVEIVITARDTATGIFAGLACFNSS